MLAGQSLLTTLETVVRLHLAQQQQPIHLLLPTRPQLLSLLQVVAAQWQARF
jgi:hypothetical protein